MCTDGTTSNNLQTYTIIEVRDEEKKKELAEIAGDQPWVEAPLVLLFCADLNRAKNLLRSTTHRYSQC